MSTATVDLYVLRAGDCEPKLQPVPLSLTHDECLGTIAPWTRFSGSPTAAAAYILANPYTAARDGLSSLWIDLCGTVHVIPPHHHALTSFFALIKNCEPGYGRPSRSKSRITFQDLTRASGIMRAQYYASQGVGLSVVLENPPNHAQLIALDALHSTTPGTRFTAELYQGGELIDSVTEYGEFVLTT